MIGAADARFAAEDYRGAHVLCLESLRRDGPNATAFALLGRIALAHDAFAQALAQFDRALAIKPDLAPVHALRGQALARLQRLDEARLAADAAERLAPQDALTLDTLGVIYSHAGDHARALPFFARAAALAPDNPNILHNLGVAQQFNGDLAAAETAFRAELLVQGEARRPYAALVHLSRQTREANFIPELERQFARADGDANARLQIGHALAKTHDDLGEYAAAFAWLERAKALKRAEIGYRIETARALFDAALDAHKAAPAAQGCPSPAPIFIVGMPRTGTTLVDRILSSHRDVVSAGELGHMAALTAQAATPHLPQRPSDGDVLRAAARADPSRLGEAYIAAAANQAQGAARFIDKMPINFLYAGLIHRALPNARIICLRRDPMDAVLSNYRQIFGPEAAHYWYAFDLEQTAHYCVAFDRLIAGWRALLPADRFMEVYYEDVVHDLETQARRLVAFCGLDWDARCLSPHENDSPVATASSVQVRAPVYSTSIGRWRRYGDAMAPAAAILRAAGLLSDR